MSPWTDEWIKIMWSIYTMEYDSALKMKILLSVTTQMNLENLLSERTEGQVPHDSAYRRHRK